MGDMGEFWKDTKPELKRMSREKRRNNRKHGESELFLKRIPFLKKNDGAHLIVNPDDPKKRVDYWPGTGLWRSYWGSAKGRGLVSLLQWLAMEKQNGQRSV
jgi:hypothetical protein